MWRYRSETIFVLALAFALKSIVHPDTASVCGLVLFLGAHYVDRFFDKSRAESQVAHKFQAFEDEMKVFKQELSRISMTVGIRGQRN